MTSEFLFQGRKFHVAHWMATPGFASAASAAIDLQLKQFIHVELFTIKSLEDAQQKPIDMLIISAEGLDDEVFPDWIQKIVKRIPSVHGIQVPTLIFADISSLVQRQQLQWAVAGNWYFDIVDSEHASSLPIRMTNLLRIFDHLHEVRRMSEVTRVLTERVKVMEFQLTELLKKHWSR